MLANDGNSPWWVNSWPEEIIHLGNMVCCALEDYKYGNLIRHFCPYCLRGYPSVAAVKFSYFYIEEQ